MSAAARQLLLAAAASVALTCASALALVPASVPLAPGPEVAGARAYSAVQARATEFALTLSRSEVSAGRVRVELLNSGEDEHDLLLVRDDGGAGHQWPVTAPRTASAMTVRLGRGRWTMVCTLPDHAERGMVASLRVRRARRSGRRESREVAELSAARVVDEDEEDVEVR